MSLITVSMALSALLGCGEARSRVTAEVALV